MPNTIKENFLEIQNRIITACKHVNRDPAEVRLLVATKTQNPENIIEVVKAGATLIGENKVQEYTQKFEFIKNLPVERHFIGHLQSNKVKELIKFVTCVQSIDTLDLAQKLSERLVYENKFMDIFIQINTSNELSKSGADPIHALNLIQEIAKLPNITIKGLMTIGALTTNEADIRNCFIALKNIQKQAIALNLSKHTFNELSMGMSHDLEIAIQEGATIIRVGTAIFGSRN